MLAFAPAIVGDDGVVGDGNEKIGEKLSSCAALTDCERHLLVDALLLHARLGVRTLNES
jgi:hypothetical protein